MTDFDIAWNLLRDIKWFYDLHSVHAPKFDTEEDLSKRVDDFIQKHMADVFSRRTREVVDREFGFHESDK